MVASAKKDSTKKRQKAASNSSKKKKLSPVARALLHEEEGDNDDVHVAATESEAAALEEATAKAEATAFKSMKPEAAAAKSKYDDIKSLDAEVHIRRRPGMYCGSKEHDPHENLVACHVTNSVEANSADGVSARETLRLDPTGVGLRTVCGVSDASICMFKEIRDNCLDRFHKDPTCNTIKCVIDTRDGWATLQNNGVPINTGDDPDLKMSFLQAAFTKERTGGNMGSVTGLVVGQNGYGAKITTWLSERLEAASNDVEAGKCRRLACTYDPTRPKKPVSTRCTLGNAKGSESYVRVKFMPDWEWHGYSSAHPFAETRGLWAAWTGMIYEAAAVLESTPERKIKVTLKVDDQPQVSIPVGSAKFCARLFGEGKTHAFTVGEVGGPRLTVSMCCPDPKPPQESGDGGGGATVVGYVNGTRCDSGDHVGSVLTFVRECVEDKFKGLKPATLTSYIRQRMSAVVVAWINTPTFDSQRKVALTTKRSRFGFPLKFTDEHKKAVLKTGIVAAIREQIAAATGAQFEKDTTTAKAARHLEIDGLDDAVDAGKPGAECDLWLAEGKSAKGTVMWGLDVIGHRRNGVYALRGKILNLQNTTSDPLSNAIIKALVTIVGLSRAVEKAGGYTREKLGLLRYRRVILATDQDDDGFHIRALVIQFFRCMFPSVLRADPNFILFFGTQIIRIGDTSFFTKQEYAKHVAEHGEPPHETVKYYKGLGVHSRAETVGYFRDLGSHLLPVTWDGDAAEEAMDMAMNKKRADDRKGITSREPDPDRHLDYSMKGEPATVSKFVDLELSNYFGEANLRAIPDLMDGLKPSQRMAVWTALEANGGKGVRHDLSVARFATTVAETCAYSQGEGNLEGVAVNLMQVHVGTNNVNLLVPEGFAGSRFTPVAAAARYLQTRLEPVAELVFRNEDVPVLDRAVVKGKKVQPKTLRPVVPWVLVNGAFGMGEGYSTTILPHRAEDVIAASRHHALGATGAPTPAAYSGPMDPHYEGWTGKATRLVDPGSGRVSWCMEGVVERLTDTTFRVTELAPSQTIETWMHNVRHHKVKKVEVRREDIKSVVNRGGDTPGAIDILVTTPKPVPASEDLFQLFRLRETLSEGNQHVFRDGVITKYDRCVDIVAEHAAARLAWYRERLDHQLASLRDRLALVSNRLRFVRMVVHGEMTLVDRKTRRPVTKAQREQEMEAAKLERLVFGNGTEPSFAYLHSMSIDSLCLETVEALEKEAGSLEAQIADVQKTSPGQVWLRELDDLEAGLAEYRARREKYLRGLTDADVDAVTGGLPSSRKGKRKQQPQSAAATSKRAK